MVKQELTRCTWGNNSDELYRNYHDHEWGKLNLDEKYLYEMLVLESFQSGLTWATILHKRENFRQAFAGFDVEKVAQFTQADFEQLMQNSGIIRNRLKIRAAINNAQVLVKWHQADKTFRDFLLKYIPQPLDNHYQKMSDVPASTPLSTKVSKAMKQEGFKFVGPVTVYSFLQAVGLVNDHLANCQFRN
ncbi:DNA-3-methyladenine glycosylase I [Lactobacillus sp. PV034]|uniref:DNA-3-methyladenine glycosylase I n=1 Tax=Lactobacillus sp. PV034 TaxID=2594495 RepID=UPI00223F8FBB|nr:DNA-3-methyladenine glycosylase I [Lactobacillus sp. PV034]QNQ80540.1 DNA-3-methyladenine glycosylase I [Lactobacillus sp. PV034]